MERVFGEQHERALATIARAHEQVCADAQPRMVALVGDTGTGKTFLVQHFYRRLARDQRYWPPDIHQSDRAAVTEVLTTRGVVDPGMFSVAPGVEIPWFWWGLRCLRPPGARRPVDALNEGASQLAAHLGPLLLRLELRRKGRQAVQQIVSGVVSAVPVLTFVEAARQAGQGVYTLVRAAYEAHQSRGAATGGAAAGADPAGHDEEATRRLGESLGTGGGIEDSDVQRALAMLSYAHTGLAREHAREARFARDRGENRAGQLAAAAEALHRRALRGRRRLVAVRRHALGPTHPETLRAQLNLAASHAYLDEHEEALRLRRNVKRQRARFLQPTHPDYLSALSAWAKSLSDSSRALPPARRRQRLRRAADALQEVLDRRLELYGRLHKTVARAAATLAGVHEDLDRPGEAVELRRLVLEQREAQRARDHSEVRLAASKLTAVLEASGQAVEAGRVRRDYLDG